MGKSGGEPRSSEGSEQIEDHDAAAKVFFVVDVALGAAGRGDGRVVNGQLEAWLIDPVAPVLFFFTLSDLLDDEGGQHVEPPVLFVG